MEFDERLVPGPRRVFLGPRHYHVARTGVIYEDVGTPGSPVTVTVAGTYYKWVTAGLGKSTAGVFADAANSQFIIRRSGDYVIKWNGSFSGSVNATFTGRVHVNTGGGPLPITIGGVFDRKISTGGDVGTASCRGLIVGCTAGDIIDMRFTALVPGNIINLWSSQLSINPDEPEEI